MSKCLIKHRLTVVTILSVICSVIIGVTLKNFTVQPWSERNLMYFQFPAKIFLQIINCLILPLIVSNVVSASCRLKQSGSIGLKALCYYLTTTTLGITLCLILTEMIKPGVSHNVSYDLVVDEELPKKFVTVDALLDLLRNLFPDNIVRACFSQYQTILINSSNLTDDIYHWRISHHYTAGTNVLGIVAMSLLLGIAIGSLEENRKPLFDFFKALSDATSIIMDWMIMLVPVGILILIPGKILEVEDMTTMISSLGIYLLTVVFGLLIHGLIILPTLYIMCTRKSPFRIFSKMGPAVMTAIGTSSSTATVPTTIKCLDAIGIDRKVSDFIAPVGATINMDGIALYETIGALFIIQQRGMNFSLMRTISIAIICTVSCIGAAGLPSGGYVMLIVVLESIGIPAEDVTLIITIDCFVDRLRTIVNIVADIFGAAIIDHFSRKSRNIDVEEMQQHPMLSTEDRT